MDQIQIVRRQTKKKSMSTNHRVKVFDLEDDYDMYIEDLKENG
jgi:hypothetical protein